MSHRFSQENFSAHLNSEFQIATELGDSVELKLIEVREIQSDSKAFYMLFLGPYENFLHQHTYKFQHKALGAFELFIVPVGQRDDGYIYQAIFDPLAE